MKSEYNLLDPSHIALCLIKPYSKVLSNGCGAGREVKFLVREKKCKVTALDRSERVINSSKKVEPNATYLRMDFSQFKKPESFDYVLCLDNSINYLLDWKVRRNFIKNSFNNLKPGGILIIGTSHRYSTLGKFVEFLFSNRNYYYTPSQIKKWFKGINFKISQTSIGRTTLITAKKQNDKRN